MTRAETLQALIELAIPVEVALLRLAEFPWDSETDLVQVTPTHFQHILCLFKQERLSAADVEAWANAVECREDIGVADSSSRELLHELANPYLTQALSQERADFLLSQLYLDAASGLPRSIRKLHRSFIEAVIDVWMELQTGLSSVLISSSVERLPDKAAISIETRDHLAMVEIWEHPASLDVTFLSKNANQGSILSAGPCNAAEVETRLKALHDVLGRVDMSVGTNEARP